MPDMLPDNWLVSDQSEQISCGGCRLTMDIWVWTKCFATYVQVIAEDEPYREPDLLDYMIYIIWASQDFMAEV